MRLVQESTTSVVASVTLRSLGVSAKTDVAWNTASTKIWIQSGNAAAVEYTPVTGMSAGTWVSLGLYHVGNGRYLVGVPDSYFASASHDQLTVWIVTPDAEVIEDVFQIVGFDPTAIAVGASTFDSAADGVTVTTNNDKTEYGLTAATITAIAGQVDAAMLDGADGTDFIAAVVAAIGNTNITATAIRDAILDRVLSGNHDTADTLGKVIQDIVAAVALVETKTQADTRQTAILAEHAKTPGDGRGEFEETMIPSADILKRRTSTAKVV